MYALMETVPNWKDEAKFARVVAVVTRPDPACLDYSAPWEAKPVTTWPCGILDVAYRELIVATHFQNND